MVSAEANTRDPLRGDFERMARRRYQKGQLFQKGKRRKVWVARWREDVIRPDGSRSRHLGGQSDEPDEEPVAPTWAQVSQPTQRIWRPCVFPPNREKHRLHRMPLVTAAPASATTREQAEALPLIPKPEARPEGWASFPLNVQWEEAAPIDSPAATLRCRFPASHCSFPSSQPNLGPNSLPSPIADSKFLRPPGCFR